MQSAGFPDAGARASSYRWGVSLDAKEGVVNMLGKVLVVFWLLVLGYLGFYAYVLVLGGYSPAELAGFTVAAVVLAALFALHAVRVRHAMREHGHEEMMRGLHRYRERWGF
jgi:hypothetical protein